MSLRDTEPVPSRVIGLVHTALVFAAENPNTPLSKSAFDQLVTLRKQNRTIYDTVFGECVFWGFFTREAGDTFRVREEFVALSNNRTNRTVASERFVFEIIAPAVRDYILPKLRNGGDTADYFDAPFSRMLAWVLMQNANYFPLTKSLMERLSADQDANKFIGWTQTNHEGFVHWAHFLGFQHQHNLAGQTAYQPDPTQALRGNIDAWLPDAVNESVPIGTVQARIETLFPWLENGAIAEQARAGLSAAPAQGENELSPALALALRRMERTGVIRLQTFSDANLRILTWAGKHETVSHIARQETQNNAK